MVKARKDRSRIGRPPMAKADRRDTLVRVLTTKIESAELREAASSASMSASAWVRSVALERARAVRAEKARPDVPEDLSFLAPIPPRRVG